MISKQTLLGFIGIDYSLIRDRREANMAKFHAASGFVMLILLLTFLSVFYAFDLLFHNVVIGILLASFFSLMLGVMYIFLLQTFNKESISHATTTFIVISHTSRIAFVLLLGFIISKPIEAYIFEEQLNNDIVSYKTQLKQDFDRRCISLYARDIQQLQQKKLKYGGQANVDAIKAIDEKLAMLLEKIKVSQVNAAELIDNSDFFLQRLFIVFKHYRTSWLICFAILFLFALPVYLIYTVSGEGAYYKAKSLQDKKVIIDSYREFKICYSEIFKSKYHLDITFYEAYENPPFTKTPKKGPTYSSQKDLFNKLFPSEKA